jgi:uncharacterized SAM-binding protein YcdF (DUF218 family)
MRTGSRSLRHASRALGLAARLAGFAMAVAVLGLVVFIAGFGWFLWSVPNQAPVFDRKADGIVVLTGGASRTSDGMELLAAGRGQRLLISGAHRTTNQAELVRLLPEHEKIILCCVDIDREALNTVGNATGTRQWVKERNFRSVIVVTSNYHMPRAMAELSHQLPDVDLIPFPVIAGSAAGWTQAASARLLVSEYVKYLVAVLRMQFDDVAFADRLRIFARAAHVGRG